MKPLNSENRLDQCKTAGCGHPRAGHDLGGCIRGGCVCLNFSETTS